MKKTYVLLRIIRSIKVTTTRVPWYRKPKLSNRDIRVSYYFRVINN